MSETLYVAFRLEPGERKGSGHVRVQVFAGRQSHSRGNCGTIVMRVDEWNDLEASLTGHVAESGSGPDRPYVIFGLAAR